MKLRSTLILLVIGLALGAYLYFVELKVPTTREIADNASHVVSLDREKIDAISIRSPEAKIELRKQPNGQWQMEEPTKDRADSAAVNELISHVDSLHSEAQVDVDPKKKEQLKEYGVLDATTRVKFVGGGKTVELLLGGETAVDNRNYVYEDGSHKVHAVANTLRAQVTKKGDDFRDRKLADITPSQVNKVTVQSGAGLLELVKKNSHWQIEKPLQARGDDGKVNDLIARALTAHVDDFIPEANASGSGLSEPRGTLAFTVEGQDKPVLLNLGGNPKEEKDKEKTYARLSTRDATVLLPKSVESVLSTKPNDVRDKNLLRVESDIVDRMTIEPAGGEKMVLGRKGESWVRKLDGQDVPINAALATKLLADLQAAQVQDFVSDVATDLPKYGLDNPQLKVTLSSYASDNTSETNAGDKPIETVLFGLNENGKVYAKLESEPFLVSVSPVLTESFPRTPLALRELTIFQDKPEEITAVEINMPEQGSVSLDKTKENKWKLAKGDSEVDQASLQTLATTLASLHAVRWIGPAQEGMGIDHPNAIVTATLTQGDKTVTRKLTIGYQVEDRWHAAMEGKDEVFQISGADYNSLTTPLKVRLTPPAPVVGAAGAGAPAVPPMVGGAPIPASPAAGGTAITPPVTLPAGTAPGPDLSGAPAGPMSPGSLAKPLAPAAPATPPADAPPVSASGSPAALPAPPVPPAPAPVAPAPAAPAPTVVPPVEPPAAVMPPPAAPAPSTAPGAPPAPAEATATAPAAPQPPPPAPASEATPPAPAAPVNPAPALPTSEAAPAPAAAAPAPTPAP